MNILSVRATLRKLDQLLSNQFITKATETNANLYLHFFFYIYIFLCCLSGLSCNCDFCWFCGSDTTNPIITVVAMENFVSCPHGSDLGKFTWISWGIWDIWDKWDICYVTRRTLTWQQWKNAPISFVLYDEMNYLCKDILMQFNMDILNCINISLQR